MQKLAQSTSDTLRHHFGFGSIWDSLGPPKPAPKPAHPTEFRRVAALQTSAQFNSGGTSSVPADVAVFSAPP